MDDVTTPVADALIERAGVDWSRAAARARSAGDVATLRGLEEISRLSGIATGNSVNLRGRQNEAASPLVVISGWAGAMIVAVALVTTLVRQLAAPGPVLLPQLIVVLSFAGVAAWLFSLGNREIRITQYATVCLLVAAAFSRPLLADAAEVVFVGAFVAPLRGVYPETLLPAVLWAFAQRFPFTYRFTAVDTLSRHATAAAGLFGIVAFILNAAHVHGVEIADSWWTNAFLRSTYGRFWLAFYGLTFPALLCIAARCWRADPGERKRVLALAAGLAGGSAPVVAAGILQVSSPAYQELMARASSVTRVVDALVWLGLISIPITTALSIALRGALPVRRVLAEAAKFLLARNALKTSMAVLMLAVAAHLIRERDKPLSESLYWIAHYPLGAAVVVLVLFAANRRIVRLVDRAFGHQSVDHARSTAAAVARVGVARDQEAAAVVVSAELQGIYAATSTTILQRDERNTWAPLGTQGLPLPGDSSIPSLAAEGVHGLCVRPGSRLFDLLPGADQAWVLRSGTELVFSIGSPQWGLLGLGARSDRLPYSRSDRLLITTLAAAAAHAVPRAERTPGDRAACSAFECPECGLVSDSSRLTCACGVSPVIARVPRRIAEKFEILRRAGAGGMGVVYAATDLLIGRPVALKAIHVTGPDLVGRVLREAQAMGTALHPNLAQIYSVELVAGMPVLVVEWMPGGTLADRLARGPIPWAEAMRIGVAIADALSRLHAAKLIHKDVKPSNIGFGASGDPKLLDFGLASAADHGLSDGAPFEELGVTGASAAESLRIAGTPLYLSPEILAGAPPGPEQDLWALALVLYESVAGSNPFRGNSVAATVKRIRRADVTDIRLTAPAVPAAAADFFRDALSSAASRQPRTSESMRERLSILSAM